ncbi:MAG: ABC transporter ATP-binding protein [Oscillospiraceae bacterium]|nr:ABC transporter ATP-binding protein [Oscillospiraceae bacterium]
MRKLFAYLKEYRKECVLGPLFKLLEASLELFVPMVVAAVIDRGIAFSDHGYIVRMSLLLVGFGLAGLAFSVTAQYFSAKAAIGFVTRLRHALYAHVQTFSHRTLDTIGIPTLITRMTSDMNQVQTGLNLTLRLLLRSPFVVFGAMLMAFMIDAKAALWFLAVIPALALVVFGIMLVSIPLYRRVQEKLDAVLGSARENLNGVRVLRAFRREAAEQASFGEKNTALTRNQRRVGRVSALMNPITLVIVDLAVLGLLRTGSLRVNAGLLTQGAVVALYHYMGQILVELIKLANLIINVTKAVACGKRIQAVLDVEEPQTVEPELPKGDPSLRVELRDAGIRYHGSAADALSGIDLRVKPGQTVGLIGGTGSGKSTLVSLIPRFYTATSGAVFVDGTDVRAWDPESLRRKIGFVPQKAVLFHGTIRENLLWGNEAASDDELLTAASLAQASDVLAAKGGLDGVVEQFGRNLSGGQRQRLTIARALVRRPEILILDDSASALDFATDAALRKALRSLDYDPTVFLVSQRTSTVRSADQILVLDDGKAVGLGTHDELLRSCPVYREIYDSQFRKEGQDETAR